MCGVVATNLGHGAIKRRRDLQTLLDARQVERAESVAEEFAVPCPKCGYRGIYRIKDIKTLIEPSVASKRPIFPLQASKWSRTQPAS